MKEFKRLNFHKHTFCVFKFINEDFFQQNSVHYKSKSGSSYFFVEDGVYRGSNHWGRVANCRWKIQGINNYKNQNYYVGFANWEDFYLLNSTEKAFYLQVDYNTGFSTILKETNCQNSTKYLMSLNLVFKRQKEILALYKNFKWANYLDEDIEILRNILIGKLLTSEISLQILKQCLKNEFN